MASLKRNFDTPDSPFRVRLTPDVMKLATALKSPEAAMKLVGQLKAQNTRHLIFNNGIKLFADGAMFSQAMQIGDPGYIDGHHGEWISQPGPFGEFARSYWDAGYQLADFAVLDKDPYEVGVKGLRGIKVWGTVFEGEPHPAKRIAASR